MKQYYGVEPYTGRIISHSSDNDYIQHFGIPGMKWGWTKDGRKTGAKEAMTEEERKARRQQLLKRVGTALGVAGAVAGTALAIKNRKKIGQAINNLRNRRIADKVNGRYTSLKNRISSLGSKALSGIKERSGSIKNRLSSLGSNSRTAAGTAMVRANLLGKEISSRGSSALSSLGNKTRNTFRDARTAADTARVRANLLGKEISSRGSSALSSLRRRASNARASAGRNLIKIGNRIGGFRR